MIEILLGVTTILTLTLSWTTYNQFQKVERLEASKTDDKNDNMTIKNIRRKTFTKSKFRKKFYKKKTK